MQKPFQIIVDDRHVAEALERKHLAIRAIDGKSVGKGPRRTTQTLVHFGDLDRLSVNLESLGLIRHHHVQYFLQAKSLIASRLVLVHQQHHETPSARLQVQLNDSSTVSFAPETKDGGGKQWILVNSSKAIPCLSGTNVVGYFPSLNYAVWRMVQASLFTSPESVDYTDLDARVHALADELTKDIQIIEPSMEGQK